MADTRRPSFLARFESMYYKICRDSQGNGGDWRQRAGAQAVKLTERSWRRSVTSLREDRSEKVETLTRGSSVQK